MLEQPENIDAATDPLMKHAWMYWKLAIWKLVFGSLTVAGSGYVAATSAVRWSDISADERIVIMITLAVAMGKFVDAFLDQTVSRLIAGKPPVSVPGANGSTEITIKST